MTCAHGTPPGSRAVQAFPDQEAEYKRRKWKMFPTLNRVYDNTRARQILGWAPRFDFRRILDPTKGR